MTKKECSSEYVVITSGDCDSSISSYIVPTSESCDESTYDLIRCTDSSSGSKCSSSSDCYSSSSTKCSSSSGSTCYVSCSKNQYQSKMEKDPIKVQLASDLHLELNKDIGFDEMLEPSAPILILAGDVGNPTESRYLGFLEWCSSKYDKVILIAGNHEYYSIDREDILGLKDRKSLIGGLCRDIPNIHFLDNEVLELNDDTIVIGTTLWSYIKPEETLVIENCLNDFSHIYLNSEETSPKPITTSQYNEIHVKCYQWLRKEIKFRENKNIIIVSHHLPSFNLIAYKYRGNPLNSAFASELDHLFALNNVKYWFYGHTHSSGDVIKENCRLVCNPHGYSRRENREYKKDFVVDVSEDPKTDNLPKISEDGKYMTFTLQKEDSSYYNHPIKIMQSDPPEDAWE